MMKSEYNDELIPFGKYQGQPIEVLASDPSYMEWLIAQQWFRTRHDHLYQVVINNFAEPSETPEHNAMQVRFLDPEWQLKVIAAIQSDRAYPLVKIRNVKVTFEVQGLDVIMQWNEILERERIESWNGKPDVRYPTSDHDIICAFELKPSVGDDYPAVLRQVLTATKANTIKNRDTKKAVLVVGSFSSQAVTAEQFRQIFASSGVHVIFISEIESMTLPDFFQKPESPPTLPT